MWRPRLKKFTDNPFVIFTFARTHLYYRFIADDVGTTYPTNTLNSAETFKALIEKDQSIIRSGDGTVGYLLGASIYFNNWHFRYNRTFAKKLYQVLQDPGETNILFCYPFRFLTKSKADFIKEGIEREWSIWIATKVVVRTWLKPNKTYGDAFVFHPRFNPSIDFAALKQYLDTKHIVIITSNTERFKDIKLGRSITLIEGPSSDAWQVYEELEAKAFATIREQAWQPSEVLLMVSAAEAAKVMVYNFTKAGYTAWDTGQFFDLAAQEISQLSQ
jgi:Glycosyltransferase GT-D fold